MNQAELFERLKQVEETLLLELLNITSEDIVSAFMDRIVEYENQIRRSLAEEDI